MASHPDYVNNGSIERVGFDYDGTLTQEKVREIAKEKLASGSIVYIVTKSKRRDDILETAKELGIREDMIYFDSHPKWPVIRELDLDLFYDNAIGEIYEIEDHTHTDCILV